MYHAVRERTTQDNPRCGPVVHRIVEKSRPTSLSHGMMQFSWKRCLHGSLLSLSPTLNASLHTVQPSTSVGERERTGIYITKEEEGPVCGCESSAHTMVHCNEFFEYPVTTHYILWLGQVVKTSLWALWRHSTQIQGSLRKESSGDIHWEW